VEFPRFLGELIPELLPLSVAAGQRERKACQGKGKENVDAPHGVFSVKIHCIGYKAFFLLEEQRIRNAEWKWISEFRFLLAGEIFLIEGDAQ